MTYAEAIDFLHRLGQFGMRPGLETSIKLAALAGNPQAHLRFIHVAGTNGKGSTCAFLESIYRAAGLRTGLYTSPHLVSFRERIQINRRLIPEANVARLAADLQSWCREFPEDGQPTFFEAVTAMALRHFAEQQCDVVIWETGLGGRLDATNIVTPLASVITHISLDHTQWLGGTLAQIAAEKAGIIKPGVPVIKADDPREVLEVIERVARENSAPLRVVTAKDSRAGLLDRLELPLAGEHQRLNAAVALATADALQGILPVAAESIERGLRHTQWAGRLQRIATPAGGEILLDGAHNPSGATALRAALEKLHRGRRPALLLGVLADKDWREVIHTLAPLADHICVVAVASPRSLPAEELAVGCRAVNPESRIKVCASVAAALRELDREPFVLIAGSLYLVGEALEQLGAGSATGERALNDFSPAPAG